VTENQNSVGSTEDRKSKRTTKKRYFAAAIIALGAPLQQLLLGIHFSVNYYFIVYSYQIVLAQSPVTKAFPTNS
jgi:hypothetical protein